MIKINKRLLALMVTGSLALAKVPHAKAEIKTEGDILQTTSSVSLHTDTSVHSKKIMLIPRDEYIFRFLSYDNGWAVIRYGDHIGFIKSSQIKDLTGENIYPSLEFEEITKDLQITENTYLYREPYENSKRITSILKNSIVKVIAKSNNGWYLIKSNNTFGFVFESYLKEVDVEYNDYVDADMRTRVRLNPSLDSESYGFIYSGDEYQILEENDEWYKIDYNGTEAYIMKKMTEKLSHAPIEYQKIIYFENGAPLLNDTNNSSEIIDFVEKGQTAEVINETGDFYYVHTFDNTGYIKKNYVSELTGLNIVVDTSSQKMIVYDDNKIVVKSAIYTGKDTMGTFQVTNKEENHLINDDLTPKYWVQYDNNYGLYDIVINNIQGEREELENNNQGNVSMDELSAEKVYKLVNVGTKVIIHK